MAAESQRWFRTARFGTIIHYGIYSLLGRGEWGMNKERIPVETYAELARDFTAERFDTDDLIRRSRDWGMRYALLTTKYHVRILPVRFETDRFHGAEVRRGWGPSR